MQFKIGDKVKVKEFFAGNYLKGYKGTIVFIKNDDCLSVEFEKSFKSGHSCDGHCKQGHGRFGYENELIKINNYNINVRKLNKTLCNLKKAIE